MIVFLFIGAAWNHIEEGYQYWNLHHEAIICILINFKAMTSKIKLKNIINMFGFEVDTTAEKKADQLQEGRHKN